MAAQVKRATIYLVSVYKFAIFWISQRTEYAGLR